jgi:hypothetical protein
MLLKECISGTEKEVLRIFREGACMRSQYGEFFLMLRANFPHRQLMLIRHDHTRFRLAE